MSIPKELLDRLSPEERSVLRVRKDYPWLDAVLPTWWLQAKKHTRHSFLISIHPARITSPEFVRWMQEPWDAISEKKEVWVHSFQRPWTGGMPSALFTRALHLDPPRVPYAQLVLNSLSPRSFLLGIAIKIINGGDICHQPTSLIIFRPATTHPLSMKEALENVLHLL